MSSNDIVQSYIPLVDFLAEILGPTAEVVLHDLRKKEHSMIAIRNGRLTGRRAGESTASDFAFQMADRAEKHSRSYVANYFSKPAGDSILRSSTYFIRDENGHIIGLLCVNVDLTQLCAAHDTVSQLLTFGTDINIRASEELVSMPTSSVLPSMAEPTDGDAGRAEQEKAVDSSIEDMVYSVLDQELGLCATEPDRLTPKEKRDVVYKLNDRGIFLLKGVVTEVAKRLAVSEQTVYRYLKG